MDSKTKHSRIIKKYGDSHGDEENALTGVQIPIELTQREVGNKCASKKLPRSRCSPVKRALEWRGRNPVKSVLIIATCILFIVGITGFTIMYEMLGMFYHFLPYTV